MVVEPEISCQIVLSELSKCKLDAELYNWVISKIEKETQSFTVEMISPIDQEPFIIEFKFDKKGNFLNAGFVDYKIPTAKDLPGKFAVRFVETAHPDGPYGARGIAEHPMISVPGAIGNALYYASGIEAYEFPLTPERVFFMLRNKLLKH